MNAMTEAAPIVNPIINLAGKVALVTGVANNASLAYGAARMLRQAGAEIAMSYQNDKTAKYTEALAKEVGAKVFAKMDVTEEGSLETFVDEVVRTHGRIDVVLHSMAFAPADALHGRVVDLPLGGFMRAMEVSTYSFMKMAHAVEPYMTDGGCLITMSYLGAERAVQNYGVMGLCKAALESATRYMAMELGEKGIRVHAVSPGPVPTRAASGIAAFDALMERAKQTSPLHRLVTPEDVGALCAFLASDAARGMTGEVILVDAGYHIVG